MPSNQAQLDAAARQMGFKNYDQWSAWQAHQQQMAQQPAQPAAPPVQQQPAPQQNNWLQNLIDQYTPLGGAMRKIRNAL